MAKLLFKKGSYSDLQSKVIANSKAIDGALYLTEDEGGLYLGKSDGSVKRIQGSVLYFDSLAAFTNEVAPPYSTDIIYFIADSNALVRWTGSEWKVLNATASDVATSLDALQKALDAVTITANNALPMSGTPSGKTMTGAIDMGGYKITNLAEPSAASDAVTKQYVDNKDAALLGTSSDNAGATTIHGALKAAAAAQTQADKGVSDASAAQKAADAAQSKANAAYDLAGTKTTMDEVIAKDYATKTEAQSYANTVLGTTTDGTDAKTVYGAIALANKGIKDAASAQTTADNAVKKAGDTMSGTLNMSTNFITGVKDLTESDATQEKYAANKKYVDAAKAAAIAASDVVAGNLADLENVVDGIDDRLKTVESTVSSHGTRLDGIDATLNSHDSRITDAQNSANAAAEAAAVAKTSAEKRVLTSEFNTFKESNTAAINAAAAKGDAAQKTADAALPTAGGTMTGNIVMSNSATITGVPTPTADGHVANKKYVDDGVAAAKAYADSQIAANDAMTFKGVITSSTDLPTVAGSANVGDTYKVGAEGNYVINSSGSKTSAKVGDLFINNAENDSDVPNWVHISSGYEDDYLQKLRLDSSSGKIYLDDGVNDTLDEVTKYGLGTVKFVAEADTSVVVSTVASGSDITVTVSMEWGSFD